MMKQQLLDAQSALEQLRSRRGDEFYPDFHLAPPAGWMNDPNGLIYFNGYYHAFYQHHPVNADWGPMHWGHATSKDMIRWHHELIALAPGEEYDRDGCFSGCAVDDNGVLSLIYTGHVWLGDEGDDSAIREVQCLATTTDGIHFRKQGVVLTPPDGIMHFRDPKVWREDNVWWMVLGARDASDTGQVLLYRGTSLRDWQFDRVLAHADYGDSYMWECPDFFRCGKHHYLMFSPQGMQPDGYQYRNRFQSGTLRGHWQPGTVFAQTQKFQELDHGHDFYAPQSFTAQDGRRIIMAWMDMWESPMPSKQEGWAGCMTLPRELFERDGRLCQRPVRETALLHRESTPVTGGILHGKKVLAENSGATELEITWNTAESHAERYGIRLGHAMELYADNQQKRLILWRYNPGDNSNSYRSIALPAGEQLTLRIFIDRSSAEVFVNDGDATLSSRIYPKPGTRELALFADGGSAVISAGILRKLR
ncbi:glycoside hydrolase family 32 protein [Morganella morganii]|uniref:glycoside hydrolase family 32 protein n=1 Tax=Morganella TaxID=581 RepID=UPI00370B3C91